jgi:ATP-dependent helicase/nuclease subunit A
MVPVLTIPPVPPRPPVLTPSGLGGAKALGLAEGAEGPVALAYGSLVHQLLERWPQVAPGARPGLTRRLTQRFAAELDPDQIDRAVAEAAAVLADPALAWLFAPGVAAEVALAGGWGGGRLMGVVDRLVIDGDRVLAVDLKTNRSVPETPAAVPEGLLRQMGAYRHLLAQLHPGARVEVALLWTATRALMVLPEDLTAAALARAAAETAADPAG